MVNNTELREWLVNYGYHVCPKNVENGCVTKAAEFRRLHVEELPVVNAIKAMQENHLAYLNPIANNDRLSGGLGRDVIVDGVAGSLTRSIVEMPRCGMPDYQAREEANIPEACRNEIVCARNFTSVPNMDEESTAEAMNIAADNWNNALDVTIKATGREGWSRAICKITLAALGRGVLADQYLANNRCETTLPGRVSSRIQWYLDYLAAVMSHEWGHLLGMHHIPDGVSLMNPSITRQAVASRGKPGDADLEQAYKIGYSENTEPTDEWVRGELKAVSNAKKIGTMEVDATSQLSDGGPSIDFIDGEIETTYKGKTQRWIVGPYPDAGT